MGAFFDLAQGLAMALAATTANAFRHDRDDCLAASMDEFFAKPLSREALAHLLVLWIERKAPPV